MNHAWLRWLNYIFYKLYDHQACSTQSSDYYLLYIVPFCLTLCFIPLLIVTHIFSHIFRCLFYFLVCLYTYMESDDCSQCFSTGQSAQERGLAHVPECYEVPVSERPSLNSPEAQIPVVDLTGLQLGPTHRPAIVESIRQACQRFGCFQVNLVFFSFFI